MTKNQFIRLHENFAEYAKMKTSFKATTPYSNWKKVPGEAFIWGLGSGVLDDFVVLVKDGHRMAIHYEDVKLPRLAWE